MEEGEKMRVRRNEQSGCQFFDDGRKCRKCEYSLNPGLFDPICKLKLPGTNEANRDEQAEQNRNV